VTQREQNLSEANEGEKCLLEGERSLGRESARERLPRHRLQPTGPMHGLTPAINERIYPEILVQ
jgi:hypothetical protein